MKYNPSLDFVAHAIQAYNAGQVNEASVYFAKAAAHPSVKAAIMAIDATNSKAQEQQASKIKASRAKARLEASGDLDADNVGEEERIEVKDTKKLREVQEAALDEFDEEEDEVVEASARPRSVQSRFNQSLRNIHAAAK